MYLYGGVTVQQKSNARVPADSEAGLLHAFDFATYTWSTMKTTGEQTDGRWSDLGIGRVRAGLPYVAEFAMQL
jgi:hypothetical protein